MRRGALGEDQPGDAMHQHAGLAGAGAGQHQLAAQRGGHSLHLGIVEGRDEEFGVVLHRGILGGRPRQGKPMTGRSARRHAACVPERPPKVGRRKGERHHITLWRLRRLG